MPQFPPPDAQTQEMLGIQAVGAHLEDGGFKSVYACTLANGSAAIVSVEAALGNGQAAEAAALDRLSSRPPHPHIVRFIARHAAALSYAVYERLQTELFDKVINGRLGEAVARAYFAQVVSGLRHMHRLGVSHRDIKLENIMIDQHNSLRLIDFNLSRVVPTQAPPAAVFGAAQSTDWAGSRSYRAPEVIAGAAHDMFKADVWSLGVVLFTMVTGFFFVDVATVADPRFRRAQMAQQNGLSTVQALYAMYNLPNPLSADLVTLLDGMLAIDAGARLSLDEVCSSQWMSHVGAALHAHDNVWPLSPSLWRLRAQHYWARLRRPTRLADVFLQSLLEVYVEVTHRPGGQGMQAAQAHFEEMVPINDEPVVYRGAGADLDEQDAHLPGGDEVYRGGARVSSLEELNAALEAAGVPSVEPPALCRQKAEMKANH